MQPDESTVDYDDTDEVGGYEPTENIDDIPLTPGSDWDSVGETGEEEPLGPYEPTENIDDIPVE
jgi:hypothetical protein